jgi:hypothetical protein
MCIHHFSFPGPDESLASAKVLNFDSAIASSKMPGKKREKSRGKQQGEQRTGTGLENEHKGDLPGNKLSDADRMLDTVYGDHVHQNAGQHLNGGVEDDQKWQDYW